MLAVVVLNPTKSPKIFLSYWNHVLLQRVASFKIIIQQLA